MVSSHNPPSLVCQLAEKESSKWQLYQLAFIHGLRTEEDIECEVMYSCTTTFGGTLPSMPPKN